MKYKMRGCDVASWPTGAGLITSGKITIVLEIQQNKAWFSNELRYSTFEAMISRCYEAAFYKNI